MPAAAKRSYHSNGQPDGRRSDPSNTLTLLREFIEEGDYGPGMALPPERTLADKLGVGRPAIREGIKALSILDVLESRRGDGTYIKSLDGLRIGWPARVELRRTDVNLLDLLEVRKMLEPKAARLAATRANESQMRHIEEECSKIENAPDWTGIAEHDLLLHSAIIEAAGNPILNELNNALARLLRRSREITGASAPDCKQMVDHHRRIVNAILKGEGDEAEHAMLEHLHHVGLDLISNRRR